MRAMPSLSSWCCVNVLLLIIFVQWALLAYILNRYESLQTSNSDVTLKNLLLPQAFRRAGPQQNDCQGTMLKEEFPEGEPTSLLEESWDGVAVALILRRPKWFYRRYNIMIQNALANTPRTWAVQLLVYDDWWENEILAFHRGIQRLVRSQHPRLIISRIPDAHAKKKPHMLLKEKWVWDNVVADRVLLFHGDGTLCANAASEWSDLDEYDYVGIPWNQFSGMGGAGSEFSLRHRKVMLEALEHSPPGNQREDSYFVSTLLKMNQEAIKEGKRPPYKVASPEQTNLFGGTNSLLYPNRTLQGDESWGPLVVAGTQAQLTDAARDFLIGICPEIKQIYPSLHNPTCFGAKPNPVSCALSLGFPPLCENSTIK